MQKRVHRRAGGVRSRSRVMELISRAADGIREENWEPGEYERNFGHRTARQILDSGCTGVVGNCLDKTMVVNALLLDEGFNTTMVSEEVWSEEFSRPRMHFAVEFGLEGRKHHINFVRGNNVVLGEGPYSGTVNQGYKSLSIKRVDGSKIGWDTKPFQGLYGINDARQLGSVQKHYTFEAFRQEMDAFRRDKPRIDEYSKARASTSLTLLELSEEELRETRF